METGLLEYGILFAIVIIPAMIIAQIKQRQKESSDISTGEVRTESWTVRIGTAFFAVLLGGIVFEGAWKIAEKDSELAIQGEEIDVTIASIDRIEKRRNGRKSGVSYSEYYTVTYKVSGVTKKINFTHLGSRDEEPDFAVGEILPAVVDSIEDPHELQAPETKETLRQGAIRLKIFGGAFGVLFTIVAMYILTRKPYRLIKNSDGKMKWKR